MGDRLAAGICLVFGVLWFALWGPAVVRDFWVDADSLKPAPQYRVTDVRCKATFWFINGCDFGFVHTETGEKLSFNYTLLGRLTDKPLRALQTPDGSYVTTNIGMDYVVSRNTTLFLFGGFFLTGGIVLLMQINGRKPRKKKL